MNRLLRALAAPVAVLALAACGAQAPQAATSPAPGGSTGAATATQEFPDVEQAELRPQGDGTYTVEVTISSPYDTPERYADGWRVLGPDGAELGRHTLGHDHADEQPFTRTQSGLEIPDDVTEVVVQGRDSANGYGGTTATVPVPAR